MKKIISFFLVCFLLIPSMSWVAHAGITDSQYEMYKEMVLSSSYAKYVDSLESSFPQISDTQLEEIYSRVSVLESSNSDAQALIDFVMALTKKELSERLIVPALENTLTEEEQMKAAQEMRSLQSVIQKELSHLMENLLVSFEEMQHYEQEWNFSMNLDMDIPEFMEYSLDVNLDDYIAETQGFDSYMDSRFDIEVDVDSTYESFDGNVKGNVELITVWGDIYFKAGNITFNASDMFEEEFEGIIDELNDLARENTYLHYNDMSSEILLDMLESFSPSELEKEVQAIGEVQFFEAYGKEGDIYHMRPTIEFCSFMKETLSIFDPFGGQGCSQSQYEDMLEDMAENGFMIHLTPGENKMIQFMMDNEEVKWMIELRYSDYGVISFSGDFHEPGNKDTNHIMFHYMPNETLDFDFNVEGVSLNGVMDFSRDGMLTATNIQLQVLDGRDRLDGNLRYNRGNITTSLVGQMDRTTIDCSGQWYLTILRWDFEWNCEIDTVSYFGDSETYDMSVDTNYNLTGDNNDLDFIMDFSGWDDMNFIFQMENTGSKKKISPREIKAPENHKDYFEYLYGNIYDDDIYYDDSYELTTTEYDDYSETCYTYENGDYSCTKYYNDDSKTVSCSFYVDYYDEESCTTTTYMDHDDYSETCYIYDTGDSTCYKDYETTTETCNYSALTGEEDCSTYDYGYEVIENEYEDYSETCYIYNSGTTDCTKYYEDKTEYCYEYTDTPEDSYCSVQTDEYYYDGYSDIYYYDEYEIDGKTGEKTEY